jgi:hypothetical protein
MIGFIAAFALGTSAAFALGTPAPAGSPAPTPAPTATPTAAPSAPPKVLQFDGVIDTLYTKTIGPGSLQFTGNPPASVGANNISFGGPSNNRWFDYANNTLNLEELNASVALNWNNWGGRVLLNVGPQANISYTYPSQFNSIDLNQVYLNYTWKTLTLQGGKYATLAGYEASESVNDTTVSRGILFWYQPATHLGGRLTYAPNSKVSLIGGFNDGWNTWVNTSGSFTTEYAILLNPNPTVSLTAQGYTGYEQIANYSGVRPGTANVQFPAGVPGGPPTTIQGQRKLIDLVGTVHATKALTIAANYDSGSQSCTTPYNATAPQNCSGPGVSGWSGYVTPLTGSVAQWSGLALFGVYQITPTLTGTVRYEGFHDPNGYNTGYNQLWHEGTLAFAWAVTPQLTLRTEYRHDTSSLPVFASPASAVLSNGAVYAVGNPGQGVNGNSTFGFEALAHF